MAKCTWAIKWRSTFCGIENVGPNSTASLTSGKSSAGRLCSVNRLLPPCKVNFEPLALSDTVVSEGRVRKMSMSLRAPTLVDRVPASPPRSASVRTWISRSLVVNSTCDPFLRTSTLARMGKVCRRSTMPETDCKTPSTVS